LLGLGAKSCPRSSSWAFRVVERSRRPADIHNDMGTGGSSGSMGWGGPESWDPSPSTSFWDSLTRHVPSAAAPAPAAPLGNQKEGKMISEGPTSFWTPPPVAYGPESRSLSGKGRAKKKKTKTTWMSFYQVDALDLPVPAGQIAMLLKARRSGDESDDDSEPECGPSVSRASCTYWDRHLGRRLVFLQPLSRNEHVHYDASVFGMPLPDATFWSDSGNYDYKKCRRSTWAYFHPHPSSQSPVGSEASLESCRPGAPPAPEPLPASTTAGNIPESIDPGKLRTDAFSNDQPMGREAERKRKVPPILSPIAQRPPAEQDSRKKIKLLVPSSTSVENNNEVHARPALLASEFSRLSQLAAAAAAAAAHELIVPVPKPNGTIAPSQRLCDAGSNLNSNICEGAGARDAAQPLRVKDAGPSNDRYCVLELLTLPGAPEADELLDWGLDSDVDEPIKSPKQALQKGSDTPCADEMCSAATNCGPQCAKALPSSANKPQDAPNDPQPPLLESVCLCHSWSCTLTYYTPGDSMNVDAVYVLGSASPIAARTSAAAPTPIMSALTPSTPPNSHTLARPAFPSPAPILGVAAPPHERILNQPIIQSARPLRDRLWREPPNKNAYNSLHERLSASAQTSGSHQTLEASVAYPVVRQRGKKRSAKKNRGGIRGGLVKQFGKPFWDIVGSMTDEDYAMLSPAQQIYITLKVAEANREDDEDSAAGKSL
jgi:hypothetical protein